ncbi:MAG: HYR domain-containing protein [Blastocatellia bacterium]
MSNKRLGRSLTLWLVTFVALLAAMAGRVSTQVEDITAPRLVAFSRSPTPIDVSAGSQDVTFTLRITDDLSGFQFGVFEITSPSGQQTKNTCCVAFPRVSGDAQDGIYQFILTFPQFSEAGSWHVRFISLQDVVGNGRTLSESDFIALGFPATWEVTGGPDLVAPNLTSFNINPTTIDVNDGPKNVTFTLGITDELSGFQFGVFEFVSPSGQQRKNTCCSTFPRILGNANNGVYEIILTFPHFSEEGSWRVSSLSLQDAVGNNRLLRESDFMAMSFPTTLQILSDPDDTTPPALLAFSISPTAINTTTSSQDVTFTLRITDDLSGFQFGVFGIGSPSGQQSKNTCCVTFPRISGDPQDGIYQFALRFPQFSEVGTWHVSFVSLQDVVGNGRTLSEADFTALGFPTTLEITQNQPPVARCRSVTIQAGESCAADASIDNGSFDLDSGDMIALTQSPAGPYPVGMTSVTLTVTDNHGASSQCSATVTVNPPQLTTLGPANLWLGLKNSDDVGTRFDLLAEVLKNGSPIGSGQLNGVAGGGSGFNNAVLRTVNLALSAPGDVCSGDTLSIKLSVRIAVGVSGHRSGTARLWFNDSAANTRFGAIIGGVGQDYFMLDSFTLGSAAGPGPKRTIDVFVDRAVGGNPFKPFGTWTKTF